MSPTPRIAIIGGGVGGLALHRALGRVGLRSSLYEARPTLAWPVDRGLGLWDDARASLRALGVDLDAKDGGDGLGLGRRIAPAAYRNRAGTWLSKCSDAQAERRRVASVSQNALLAALAEEGPLDGTSRIHLGHALVGAAPINTYGGAWRLGAQRCKRAGAAQGADAIVRRNLVATVRWAAAGRLL